MLFRSLIKNQAQNCVINSIEYTDAGIYPSSSHAVINNSSNGYLSDYGTRNVFVGGLAISNIGGFGGSFYIATGSSGNNPRTYIDSVTIGGNEQFLFNGGTYATDFSKRIAYYNPTSYGNAVKAKVQSTGMIDSTCGGMILNPMTGSWYRLIAVTGSKGSTLTGNKGGNGGRVRIQTSAYNNDVDLEFDYSLDSYLSYNGTGSSYYVPGSLTQIRNNANNTLIKSARLTSGTNGSVQEHYLDILLGNGSGAQYPDRKSTRLNSSHIPLSRMPSSA